MSSTAESFGVRLKRKVLSTETKLFEWRPCSCTVVDRDGKLLLELQTPRDEDNTDESNVESITIDLATQLLNVVPKKNKARCDLEFYAPVSTMSRDVLKEELMAPSAAHCQQWITQVRRVQQQALQQRRPTSSTSTRSGAFPVVPLPSPLSYAEISGSRVTVAPSSVTREASPLRRQVSRQMSESELAQPEFVSSPERQSPLRSESLSKFPSCQVRGEQLAVNNTLDHTVDSSSGSPAPAFEPDTRASISSISSVLSAVPSWRRNQVSSPQYSSSSDSDVPHSPHRSRRGRSTHAREFEVKDLASEDEHEPARYRRRFGASEVRHTRSQGVKLASSSLSSRSSIPYRVSSRTHQNSTAYEEGESSQAELHILQRVEAALRALELENAQAKARERELVQELQTLRDAARVTAAERKHIEHEFRHARREVDSWRRAAQGAEAAAAQLQEQLGIAREENQLLAGEKLRLKRQNNELLTQVHRLDSLVYGRF
ncbi:hypothetical protein P3T76_005597 [Phytophthora citrophthora]|uniref:Uncharacterized protein n=1 Tax=Phytophthora citrophthora TaxID=4793 RepID=A0AAD9GR00_9STRA|nr:hypothetical protein P3T76_005597 [Phytophthora citrophthora]